MKHYLKDKEEQNKKNIWNLNGKENFISFALFTITSTENVINPFLLSILRSTFHALSVYVDGEWISDKTPKEINDQLLTQRLYLKPLSYKQLPLIPYKNENIYSLLLTPVKKTFICTRQHWNYSKNLHWLCHMQII